METNTRLFAVPLFIVFHALLFAACSGEMFLEPGVFEFTMEINYTKHPDSVSEVGLVLVVICCVSNSNLLTPPQCRSPAVTPPDAAAPFVAAHHAPTTSDPPCVILLLIFRVIIFAPWQLKFTPLF